MTALTKSRDTIRDSFTLDLFVTTLETMYLHPIHQAQNPFRMLDDSEKP